MKKGLIITGIILLVIIGALVGFRSYTMSFSPKSQTTVDAEGLKISVDYSRPFKKGRLIFGTEKNHALVPFGKVWRTGANGATVFETNQDIYFKGQPLKAGKYSFFTIPGEQTWTVIFNQEYGQWGVDFANVANRNSAQDVVTVEVPVVHQDKEFEQFTISVEQSGEEMEMILLWDKTLVAVPFTR